MECLPCLKDFYTVHAPHSGGKISLQFNDSYSIGTKAISFGTAVKSQRNNITIHNLTAFVFLFKMSFSCLFVVFFSPRRGSDAFCFSDQCQPLEMLGEFFGE